MKTKNLIIEEQKSVLRLFALDLLKNGHDFEIVNEALKSIVLERNYDKNINVDAIRFLAKYELDLHKH
jgi:hypothetical protein